MDPFGLLGIIVIFGFIVVLTYIVLWKKLSKQTTPKQLVHLYCIYCGKALKKEDNRCKWCGTETAKGRKIREIKRIEEERREKTKSVVIPTIIEIFRGLTVIFGGFLVLMFAIIGAVDIAAKNPWGILGFAPLMLFISVLMIRIIKMLNIHMK